MRATNEAFSRVKIDAQLVDQGWDVLDINAVRFEVVLPDRTKADYVLCDRNGGRVRSGRVAVISGHGEGAGMLAMSFIVRAGVESDAWHLRDCSCSGRPRKSTRWSSWVWPLANARMMDDFDVCMPMSTRGLAARRTRSARL
jgi:hypothetical protein